MFIFVTVLKILRELVVIGICMNVAQNTPLVGGCN